MSMMDSGIFNIPNMSRFSVSSYNCNLSECESDISIFMKEYKERIKTQLIQEEENEKSPFISFAEKKSSEEDLSWLKNNHERFFQNTPNTELIMLHFHSAMGFITSMNYSPDGLFIIVGHSSGLIQNTVNSYYNETKNPDVWYSMFYRGTTKRKDKNWVNENYEKFLKNTSNEILHTRWLFSESGYISCLAYSPSGTYIIVGHSSGLIQIRHGITGIVLCTLRNIQFPPKPVYALEFSRCEERVCYAACMDGIVYRIEIPNSISNNESQTHCIRADPALESHNMQFYGTPGILSYATPFLTQRSAALSFGITADETKMAVGYADASIKIFDMETQQAEMTFKLHKLRLQFIPKKLQRMHYGQVCALRCHDQKQNMFASGGWDRTLRIWDIRSKVGCMMTFEGVNICNDSIDLNREQCVAGSWQPTEALGVWDLVARKRLNIIRVQNRRPDVDGEYIYACRYWKSTEFNRKGKYAIIGGSGTKCVEVINLHNRYITCSYPTAGTVLAVTSFQDRIAFGGTAPIFSIVSFHDPKHETYDGPTDFDDDNKSFTLLHNNEYDTDSFYNTDDPEA